jgi:photosystem II stability/assembly factor-like uncharacterized protein
MCTPLGCVTVLCSALTGYLVHAQAPSPRPQASPPQTQSATAPTSLDALRYRFIGPQGNRVIAVLGVPSDRKTYYAGGASGGVWKSVDGGTNWRPIFDAQDVSSIGSLAVAPSDPNIVWAGTGETFIRSNISVGNGIYKSVDAGKTWTRMGLEKSGRIGRILIDPHDPDVMFAAALGHCYGPQRERGVYRTTDGGKTWEQVLFVDENTGASDIAMDPNNPRVLFAGMWQIEIKTWGKFSGGPGSGVFVSRDRGTTWKRITGHGMPPSPVGKVAVAVAPSNSSRVYAEIETGGHGVLWRSDDGGENWKLVNSKRDLNSRPHYTTRIAVSPVNDREVYIVADLLSVSYDGGETTSVIQFQDNHDIWIDPRDADRMMIGHDGGVDMSFTHAAQWTRIILPVAQMYHVDVDSQIPYNVYGNEQDGPAVRGPSNSRTGRTIPTSAWTVTGGTESGFLVPDPVDNNIVWGTGQAGNLDVWDARNHQKRSVKVWPKSPRGSPAGLLKYRFNWTYPVVISPHDHNRVYVSSQYVHETTNGGQSWKVISPDLSTGDQSRLGPSGGLTGDNLSPEYGGVIFALAESPIEKGLLWAGTNDGLVHVTRDGGAHWTNVTAAIPGLPPLGTVSNIEPSRYDAGSTYITVDLHQVNNRDPFVYKTADYGKTWKSISSDIPKSVLSYAHCVCEDPVRKGLLYLGTENAIYASLDDGSHWIPLQNNLPHAPVHWIVVQPTFNDLVVATYGRGFWIMDDITPLRELTPTVLQSDAHLFPLRPAYRFADVTETTIVPNDQSVGQNPPYGASINYYLKSAPKGDVAITIQDEAERVVRTLQGTRQTGLNRTWWDLRYETPKQAWLRTTPPGDPTVMEQKEYKRVAVTGGRRPLISYNADAGKIGPRVAPGIYTVKVVVGTEALTQKLVVKKDPTSTGTETDIRAQVRTVLDVQKDVNTVVDAINQVEIIRKQLEDLERLLGENPADASLASAAKDLNKKLYDAEGEFFQQGLAESDWKQYREPMKLYSQLLWVSFDVMSADFPPTDQHLAVFKELKQDLAKAQSGLRPLLERDVPAFNALLAKHNQRGIFVPKT